MTNTFKGQKLQTILELFYSTFKFSVRCCAKWRKKHFNFHIRTMHLDIIKVLFIHQLMHKWVVLKNNIKIYIKTAPRCFGVTVTPSSESTLIRAY